jgi:hypothetical protein
MDEPNWSLLPYQARKFFELPSEFDRKSLKRAYNKFLRIYKPEKFPAEFQKIRAAFEQLENELRYGSSVVNTNGPTVDYNWNDVTLAGFRASSKSTSDSGKRSPETPSLAQRLKSSTPSAIYAELEKQTQRTPYEYYVLAILSDLATSDQTMFFKWLLTGLKAHPHDPGLFNLLREFFQRPCPPPMLERLLAATSKVVSNDRFYFLTEKGWKKLLRSAEFPIFKKILATCESNIQDHRNDSQLVFYAELLKSAIWTADDAWMQNKLALLDEASQRDSNLGHELELLDLLKEYHHQTSDSLADSPTRQQIHDTIKNYFCLDEQEGDAKVIECQLQLADDAQALLESFNESQEQDAPLVILWTMINEDVSQRNGIRLGLNTDSRKRQQKFGNQVIRLLADLDQTWQLGTKQVSVYYALHWGAYALVLIAPFFLLYSWLDSQPILLLSITCSVLGLVFAKLYLVPKTIEVMFQKYLKRVIDHTYHRHWRSRFIPLFDASGASHQELLFVADGALQEDEHFEGAITWITPYVYEDMGLLMYSLAAPYRR